MIEHLLETIVCMFLIGILACEIIYITIITRIHNTNKAMLQYLLEKQTNEKQPDHIPFKQTKNCSSIPSVDELPPEVIAPSLKNLPKSSGFGSSVGNTNSDTQFHQRNTNKTRNKSSKEQYPTAEDIKAACERLDACGVEGIFDGPDKKG